MWAAWWVKHHQSFLSESENSVSNEAVWLEWREDAESIWAEVYGTHPVTGSVYPGDTLITFDRIFGMWCCREFKSQEFRNSRGLKKWVGKLFDMCDQNPNKFRNHSKFERAMLNGEVNYYL
jgi:hypothetical protein